MLWQVDRNQGLSSEKVQHYLEQYGLNRQPETPPRSRLSILVEQFKTLPVVLLSIAAVLSFWTGGHTDAIVIMAVVLINAVIGYATESQSERIIQSLKDQTEYTAQVLRDGMLISINIQDVVPGDVLSLKPGCVVAADARLIEIERLTIDESVLTGESLPIHKSTDCLSSVAAALGDRNNMVYKGTLVTGGQGLAVVVATGTATEIGRIQWLVGTTLASPTPMEQQLDQVGNQLVFVSSGVCFVIFGLGVLRGYGLLQMLKTSIALAVAAVPEGLPAVATTTLALGILEMRRQKVLIRRLEAIEALGSMQSLCLDKTGTLTENTMSVVELFADDRTIQIRAGGWLNGNHSIQPLNDVDLQLLLKVLVLCNETDVNGTNEIESLAGTSTEKALIELAIRAGVDVSDLRRTFPRLVTQYRSCDRNYMATLHTAIEADQQLIAVKGNPNEVLRLCQWRLEAGTQVVLSDADRQNITEANKRMAGQALRVLGVAYCLTNHALHGQKDPLIAPNTIIWLGLVGMTDPIRQGVEGAIKTFHQAGVDTIMLTGDQHPTAYAVGQTLNLSQDKPLQILDANVLNDLASNDFNLSKSDVHGFARISPTHKLQIVQALQQTGRVVAMTGDGINDAPALKAADIGIAMGHTGTDLAREVADVVLADDNLATLITAISRGRTIYSNIRKAIHFLLSTNLSEILVMLLATGAALGQPLNALQLLWLNLITDIFPGLALALEPPEAGVLNLPPRDPSESLLRATDLKRMLFEAMVISISTLTTYSYAVNQYGLGSHATTLGFLSLTSAQLIHSLSCRSTILGIFSKESLPPNLYLAAALIFSFSLQCLALMIPKLRTLLSISPISGGDGCLIILSAVLPLVVNEATKGLFWRLFEKDQHANDDTPKSR